MRFARGAGGSSRTVRKPLEGGVLGKSAIPKQKEAALDILVKSAPD